jgi:hypothetical protein
MGCARSGATYESERRWQNARILLASRGEVKFTMLLRRKRAELVTSVVIVPIHLASPLEDRHAVGV